MLNLTLTTSKNKIKCLPQVGLEPETSKTSVTANALTSSAFRVCTIVNLVMY